MKIRTRNSVYEIELRQRRFRRVEGRPSPTAPPLRVWQRFGQVGPVRVGEPVRFYWLKDRAGAITRVGLWTTAPVVEIIDEGEGEEHVDRTSAPILEEADDSDPEAHTPP